MELFEKWLFDETDLSFEEMVAQLDEAAIDQMRLLLIECGYTFEEIPEEQLKAHIVEEYLRQIAIKAIQEEYAYFDDIRAIAQRYYQ